MFEWVLQVLRSLNKRSMHAFRHPTVRHQPNLGPSVSNSRTNRFRTEAPDPVLMQKFKQSIDRHRQKIIRDRFVSFHGKNYVLDYEKRYGFEEQWEERAGGKNMGFDLGIPSSKFQEVLNLLLYLIFLGSSFMTTVDYFFKTTGPRDQCTLVYSFTVAALVADSAMRLHGYLTSRPQAYYKKWEMLAEVYLHICAVCYFTLKIMDVPQRRNILWAVVEIAMTVFLIYNINKIEYTYRFLRFLLNVQNQAKILELFISLVIILHCMATVLMCSTYPYPNHNWLSSVDNLDMSNEFSVYLRSFYFATTTILTVGYGDISPKNDLEIGIVTLVEMSGIVIFAYMINEIGYAMSNLRKEREIIDRDLSNVEKIKEHYKMNEATTNRVRTFVINQKPIGRLIEPEAERSLMSKLNEDLREEVQRQNYFQIVKTSMFFLLRWSKNFQKVIASYLTHIIFSPNQLMYQPQGKERIYIVRVGRVQIYAERSRLRRGTNNVLKTISAQLDKDNYDNTYGWTAVLSKRPSRLYAYAKDYTSAYFVDRTQFSQAIKSSSTDFEYYHELKDRLDQAVLWEALELPILQSSKHHYQPTRLIILRRQYEDNRKNKRRHIARKTLKASSKFLLRKEEEIARVKRRFSIIKSEACLSIRSMSVEEVDEDWQVDSEEQLADFRQSLKVIIEQEEVNPVVSEFESGKEYTNYFPRHNRKSVHRELQTANFVPSQRMKDEMNKSFYQPIIKRPQLAKE